MSIEIIGLNKYYKDKAIFKDFNLKIETGKINCIVGKSGCGKTTLLNILSGLTQRDTGHIVGIDKQDISYIFQEDRLIDWLSVEENLNLVLKKHYGASKASDTCRELLGLVGLDKYAKYYPQMLSGGMRQRVNIARGLSKPSKLLIMDEPFKSLDFKSKYLIMDKLRQRVREVNTTVIFVTHDIEEAIYFEDTVYVLGGNPLRIKGVFDRELRKSREEITNLI